MVARTHAAAAAATAKVNAKELFRRGPLARRVFVAVVLAATLPIAALAASDVFGFWLKRLALGNELWPRRVHLEVVGFPADASGRRIHKVARDDKFELVVHADTREYVAPRQVEFRFTSADGGRGRDTMTRVGEAVAGRDDFQEFRYEFNDVSVEHDARRDRRRRSRRRICSWRSSTDRSWWAWKSSASIRNIWAGRRGDCRSPAACEFPAGTKLTLHAASTKPLTDVRVASTSNPQPRSLVDVGRPVEAIRWVYGTLQADDRAHDPGDGLRRRHVPRAVSDFARRDSGRVAAGFGATGRDRCRDHARCDRAARGQSDRRLRTRSHLVCLPGQRRRPAASGRSPINPTASKNKSQLDAFDTRGPDAPDGERAMELQPGQTLFLSVRAADRYNLSDAPRVGASQQFALDVVTVPQLLALLERRELELRQRFEAVFAKMTDTRNLLEPRRIQYWS